MPVYVPVIAFERVRVLVPWILPPGSDQFDVLRCQVRVPVSQDTNSVSNNPDAGRFRHLHAGGDQFHRLGLISDALNN